LAVQEAAVQLGKEEAMTASKAGRIIGTGIIGVIAVSMAVWVGLGQPGIGHGNPSGSGYRDSDLDSEKPPGSGACQGTCPGGNYDDYEELWVGTNPLDPCADTTTPNDEADDKWPPDLDDNRVINVLDIGKFYGHLNYCQGDASYVKRFDLNADTCVDQTDVNMVGAYIQYPYLACEELFPDPDNDAFPTIYETEMGTDPNDNCGGTNTWPPDINGDTVVNVLDIGLYYGKISHCWPSPLYDKRLDMNADRCLDDTDTGIVARYLYQQCTP
jgi:hypothetical protein